MGFSYLTNLPLEQAVENYLTALREAGLRPGKERIPVTKARSRVTAEPVYAGICAPHYHACAMDGIALEARKTFGATETTPVTLAEKDFVRVDTGDPLPEGCDAVVMIEDVVEADGSVLLYAPAAPWQHVRQIGEDICAGDMLLPSFSVITPAAMGAMLASGVLEIAVVRRPVIGIIPTGDEIVPPTGNPGTGDIIEFNSAIFGGMLEEWGAVPRAYPIVRDNLSAIAAALRQALGECDGVILNAGSSAGREDYAAQAIGLAGRVLHHGIAIRPGKPAILGLAGPKPILGVPGYPVSGILVLEHLLRPVIAQMTGRESPRLPDVKAALSRALNSSLKYREFVRARLGAVGGRLVAVPLNRGAGVVSSFVKADAVLDVPQNLEGYEAGEQVTAHLLRPLDEIRRTLVVTGSHDPLIDEAAELMRRRWHDADVASSHVGSMGGILAVKRGEAHLAGIHLLDEASGRYNEAYVAKHFPKGGVKLVECVQRVQGLMVRPGNPLGIAGLQDLAKLGMRYVNRQKGSGTRILCDYICKREGLASSAIYGYDREEFTHTAVAALIAAGSADAGLGIYSAAKLYGLDFIPVCTEQYDLLAAEDAWELPMVRRLLETLQSPEFAARLTEMGGYTLGHPGRVRQPRGSNV